MLLNTSVVCILDGPKFLPQCFMEKTGIFLELQIIKGEPHTLGRYKGQIATYNSARIIGEWENDLESMLELLVENSEAMRQCGVEEIYLEYVIITDGHGANISVNKEQAKQLYELGIDLLISYTTEFCGF